MLLELAYISIWSNLLKENKYHIRMFLIVGPECVLKSIFEIW